MTTGLQNVAGALPIAYWPHYGRFMRSIAGVLFLAHLLEQHTDHPLRYTQKWDGWFFLDEDI